MTSNGRLSGLVTVQTFSTKNATVAALTGGTIRLAPDAAAQWNEMVAAAKAAGLVLQAIIPAGGYRSIAVQESMHSNPGFWNLDPKVKIAAVGSSTHGLGLNVDIAGYKGQTSLRTWVDAHAKTFGFIHRDLAGDPACMKFIGVSTASTGAKPVDDHNDEGGLVPIDPNDPQWKYLLDQNRRENRARLYRNGTTGRLVAINWNLPTGDPGKVAYFDNEGQAANAAATYQYVGDTVAQAKVIPDGQPWTSLLSLAHGTDSVYQPK